MAFNIRSRVGWHRLWLVSVLVWGIYLSAKTVQAFPTMASIEARYEGKLSHYRTFESGKGPNAITKGWHKQAFSEYFNSGVNLAADQRSVIVRAITLWLGFSVLMYLVGWLIAWIIQGFTRSSTRTS